MAEYRIVTKIDPSGVVQGRAKVKQELDGMAADAARTTGSMDRMTAAEFRAAGGAEGLAKGARSAADAEKSFAAALDQAAKAADAEAAALAKTNATLAEAKRQFDAGKISATQFAQVQKLVTDGSTGVTRSLGQQRAGYTQLGFQIQDITQTLALGINPMVVLAQQGGQTASALSLAFGETGAVGRAATFMAGPFGSIILAAVAILGRFGLEALAAGSAVDDAREKLEDDAKATADAAEAKAAFGQTLEGVTAALRENEKALDDLDSAHKTQARRALESAIVQREELKRINEVTLALLEQAKARFENARGVSFGAGGGAGAAGATALYAGQVQELEGRIQRIRANIEQADEQYGRALGRRVVELTENAADPMGRIRTQYTNLIDLARRQATAEEITNGTLARRITLLREQQRAAEEAQRKADQPARGTPGVATFRSRQQAIGIAGRELQGQGLRVDGNSQFGYTSGHANDADHNKYAIDVNVGKGTTEANVPDLKARFDALARSYQKRGYNVIWNGQKYLAFGNGPSGPAAGHKDHLHLYAPATIVGKETMASTAAQEAREATSAARTEEQKGDFVSSIVDQAAGRGQPRDAATELATRLESVFDDYRRRFNEEMSPERKAAVTTALTDAQAREIAESFNVAYVYPLEQLQIAMGQTGIERDIAMKKLQEQARLGRELTEVEAGMIENSVRQTDKLTRMDAILRGIRQPLEEYRQTLAALNALLAQGAINQTDYNARVAALGSTARDAVGGMPGADPVTGRSYADVAASAEEQARFAEELATFQSNREQILALGISYDALIEAAHRRHAANMNAIDMARNQFVVQQGMAISNSLVEIAEMTAGKQSAVYKVMFAASKAFAIADAILKIQQGVASAMALPFPANLAAIAQVVAAASSIISSIQAVSLNLADGGMVRGPGGPRGDRIPANLSDGEYVVNSAAVRRPGNRALLDAMNSGNVSAASRAANSNDPGRGGPRVTINNLAGGVDFDVGPGLTLDEVVITARRVVREDAPRVVAGDMRRPNSQTSKAIERGFNAPRKRA